MNNVSFMLSTVIILDLSMKCSLW